MRFFAPILALALVAMLSLPAGAAAGCPGAERAPRDLTMREATAAVQCAINQRRRKQGVRKLKLNRKLAKAARRHSHVMDNRNFFSHISPWGASLVDRIGKTGYLSGSRGWGVGENLRWGTGAAGSPRMAVIAWMRSPAHRRTLLARRYRHLGVGVALGSPIGVAEGNTAIYTADFGYR